MENNKMKAIILNKCLELAKSVKLEAEIRRLIDSGALPLQDISEAKAVLHVALQNEAWQYMPLSRGGRRLSGNLMHF